MQKNCQYLEFGKLFTGGGLIGTKGCCGEVGRDPAGLDSPLDKVTVAGETRGVDRLRDGDCLADRTPPDIELGMLPVRIAGDIFVRIPGDRLFRTAGERLDRMPGDKLLRRCGEILLRSPGDMLVL